MTTLTRLKRQFAARIRAAQRARRGRYGEARNVLTAKWETWREAKALLDAHTKKR